MKAKILILLITIISVTSSAQNIEFLEQPIYLNNSLVPQAKLLIDLLPGQSEITKPLIIAEGFDAGSITTPEQEFGDTDLDSFQRSIFPEAGTNLNDLIDPINPNQEYDIIYVNWTNGTDAIQENALVLRAVINWVNSNKVGSEPNVLLGQSMGGLISRYTLAKMEQEGVPHDVRLFIAHDSPLQGANTPLSTQYFTRHIYDNYTEAPILYGATEYLIPTLLNFAELLSFGNLEVSFPSLDDILTIQDTPAALQLNYHYVDILSNPTMLIHQDWQQEFDAMGYPQQCRNIAISNGNECAANHGFNAGDKFINLHSSLNPAVFGDLSGMLIDASIGLITTDFELVILGVLPGSSKYTFDFDLHSNPNIGASDRKVYYGKVRYEKKLLYLVTITHTMTERTKNAPNGYLPFDTYSGGFYDIRNVTNSIPINLSNSIFINPKYGFIPVVSALDIKRNNQIVNPSDYLKKYAGGVTPETALTSGFDNFIVDYNNGNATNNAHISFQVRNGNWLAEEMQVDISNPIYPSFNCQNFCSNAQITGNSNLCGTGIYSVTNEANYANWSITEGNFLVTFSANNNQVTINQVDQNQNGYVTLNVTYGNTRCGSTTISKRIWVGKPNVTNPTINGPDNKPRNTTASYNFPLVEGAIQYQWSITNAAPNCGCTTNSQGLITCPTGTVFPKFYGTNSSNLTTTYNAVTVDWGNCKGAYTLNCRAVNSCGSKDISFKVVNIYDPYNPNDPNNPCNNVLKIAPNPIKEGNINVIFGKVNPNGTPCDPIEHFPIENNNKFNVKIYDLFGERLYENNYTKNEFTIEGLHFKKGHYILNLTLNDKEMHREIFIVE